ncbi:porin family protein, partial [Carboxylicivirga marina]|uniref:porin family protein n=1 Tax=Carboxylicivirga marina TaxID=2800988 RepID=UPI00259342B1
VANHIKRTPGNMNHFLLIIFLVATSMGGVLAQDLKKTNIQFDFGTTITIPYKGMVEMNPELIEHAKTEYSADFGFFLEFLISYNLNSKCAISTGLNYNYTSYKIYDQIGLFENKGNLTNSNISIPILFKYKPIERLPLSISAGPYLGFLINANEKGTSIIDTTGLVFLQPDPVFDFGISQEYESDILNDYTSFDYGLSIQFDYEIKISQTLNGIMLTRFNYGLKNVLTNDLANKSSANTWKNYNLMIGFGLKL